MNVYIFVRSFLGAIAQQHFNRGHTVVYTLTKQRIQHKLNGSSRGLWEGLCTI